MVIVPSFIPKASKHDFVFDSESHKHNILVRLLQIGYGLEPSGYYHI